MQPLAFLAAITVAVSLATTSSTPIQPPSAALTDKRPQPAALTNKRPDVIYVPTPQPVVEAMLEAAEVKEGDVLYDLGSGDGRIPVTAARRYGIRAVGIEVDPQRIAEANSNAQEAGVTHLVTFRQEDLFSTDFWEASVVTLYLLPELNMKLRPKLLDRLKPGTRIVSHAFDMGDWQPEKELQVDGRTIYLWTIPERK